MTKTYEQWVDEVVKVAKEQILADEELRECKSFSELHDYCDANGLGCRNNNFHQQMSDELGMDVTIEVLNEAQGQVDAWLKNSTFTFKA